MIIFDNKLFLILISCLILINCLILLNCLSHSSSISEYRNIIVLDTRHSSSLIRNKNTKVHVFFVLFFFLSVPKPLLQGHVVK